MFTRQDLLLPLAIFILSTATVIAAPRTPETFPYTDYGERFQITGMFGLPLGTYLKLEGQRVGTGKGPRRMGLGNFRVERVNGRVQAAPLIVWVNRVTVLPAGTRCMVRGYETGEMTGEPLDVERHVPGPLPQAVWSFRPRLVVLSVTTAVPARAAAGKRASARP